MSAADVPEARPAPSRRTLVLLVAPIIALVVTANVANALHPTLLRNNPLLLVALEPRARWIILVAERVSFWPLLVFGTLRRLASDPLFYLLGRLYGDNAVRWAEKKFDAGTGTIKKIERLFQKAGPVLVFFFPGPLICVLSGATGMSPVLFFALNILGTLFTITVMYRFASVVSGPVNAILDFYEANWKWLTVVSIAITGLYIWNQWRKGTSEIQSLTTIEDALVGDEAGDEKEEPAT